jgi:hypothetical protein
MDADPIRQGDPQLLAAVKFLKARDGLPDVRASGKCGPPVVRRAASPSQPNSVSPVTSGCRRPVAGVRG